MAPSPLVVIGYVNANIFVQIDRIPCEGETLTANNGEVLAGGKGAIQAACAARLCYPTYLIGQVGVDAHATVVRDALKLCGVRLDYLKSITVPTGHTVVLSQRRGRKAEIVVEGANISWPRLKNGIGRLEPRAQQLIRSAGALLIQRDLPDKVNCEAAKIAKNAHVPVILDTRGVETPIPEELIKCIAILCVGEAELARLAQNPSEHPQQIMKAATIYLEMGVRQVLVRTNEHGSILVSKEEPPITIPNISTSSSNEKNGIEDAFVAAYAVAVIEGQSARQALYFAACGASSCVGSAKGTIPGMPNKKTVMQLMQQSQLLEC